MLAREFPHEANEQIFPFFFLETIGSTVSQSDTEHLKFGAVVRDLQLTKCIEEQRLELFAREPFPVNLFFSEFAESISEVFNHIIQSAVYSPTRKLAD